MVGLENILPSSSREEVSNTEAMQACHFAKAQRELVARGSEVIMVLS